MSLNMGCKVPKYDINVEEQGRSTAWYRRTVPKHVLPAGRVVLGLRNGSCSQGESGANGIVRAGAEVVVDRPAVDVPAPVKIRTGFRPRIFGGFVEYQCL